MAFDKIQESLSFTHLKKLKQEDTSRKFLLYYIEWIQIIPTTFRHGKVVISCILHIGIICQLTTTCFVPDTLLSPFILTTMLWTRYHDYFHFTDEETGAYWNLVTFPALHSYKWAGIWIWISLTWHFKLWAFQASSLYLSSSFIPDVNA